MEWKALVADKKARLSASIPKEWRIEVSSTEVSALASLEKSEVIDPSERAITELSATEIVRQISAGMLTSTAVTEAFCKRAALTHQLTNCCAEFFPVRALERAKELDDYYATNGRTVGPLHGLPISLKDQFRIKGLETAMGYVNWIGKYDTGDSILVNLLDRAGAVFYTKTTVPQSLMVCETISNITGRTVNPRNKNWSCGGSSGGEGALLGTRGSVMGVGTDIAGSIRVPSAFNFLYGLRPSHGRLPYGKMANNMEGQETIHSVCGPLCHSIEDMRLFMTSVLLQQPWLYDSKVIPMPWRQHEEDAAKAKVSSAGLTLGYYTCDGNVLPHPPVVRAVQIVVEKMQQAGHTVVQWEPYQHPYAVKLANKIYASDGGTLAKWKYQCDYLAAIREFESKHGKELDAIIAPITPTAAIRHNRFKYYGYASTINLLDYTSVVVPVTFADKAIDIKDMSFTPLTEIDSVVEADYDTDAYHGAPVAVQIIGKRLTEEKTMAIAEEIGRLLGNAVGS